MKNELIWHPETRARTHPATKSDLKGHDNLIGIPAYFSCIIGCEDHYAKTTVLLEVAHVEFHVSLGQGTALATPPRPCRANPKPQTLNCLGTRNLNPQVAKQCFKHVLADDFFGPQFREMESAKYWGGGVCQGYCRIHSSLPTLNPTPSNPKP